MIEINLLFFSRPLLMFNSSSEMSVCITFSRIPKCLHLLPFCVAVDASVRHPMTENEPTKVLFRSFILNINDKHALSQLVCVLAYHSPSGSYTLLSFFIFLFISSASGYTLLFPVIDIQLIMITRIRSQEVIRGLSDS